MRASRRLLRSLLLLALLAGAGSAVLMRPTDDDVVGAVSIGNQPVDVAVDTRTRRAFVTAFRLLNGESADGRLYVLDTHSGRLLRTLAIGAGPLAVDERTGRVFVASYATPDTPSGAGHVSVLDAAAGRLLRTLRSGRYPQALLVAETAERVAATSDDAGTEGRIQVLDAAGGRLLHSIAWGQSFGAAAADPRSGHLFVATDEDSVSTIDLRTGVRLRTVTVGQGPYDLVVDTRREHVFVIDTVTDAVTMLDARRSGVIRTVRVGSGPMQAAVDERAGRLFVLNQGSNSVSVLDTASGRLLRNVSVGAQPGAVIVDGSRGHVLVVCYGDGTVSSLDARSGHLLHRIVVGMNPSGTALDERTGDLLVAVRGRLDANGNALGPGAVAVVDTSRGRMRRRIPVEGSPLLIALDERAGRAIVVNAGVPPARRDPWAWLPARLRRWLPFHPPAQPSPTPSGSVSILKMPQ